MSVSSYLVLKRLMRTEKGVELSETENKYFFEVGMNVNKIQIKKAVEEIYKVKVASVNTSIMPKKPKILRRNPGFTVERKKAIVQLKSGHKIDLTV